MLTNNKNNKFSNYAARTGRKRKAYTPLFAGARRGDRMRRQVTALPKRRAVCVDNIGKQLTAGTCRDSPCLSSALLTAAGQCAEYLRGSVTVCACVCVCCDRLQVYMKFVWIISKFDLSVAHTEHTQP